MSRRDPSAEFQIAGTVYFLLGDHLGSTSVVTNASTGVVMSQIRYSAYGEERYTENTTPTNYRYTGQLSKVATVGLYHYGSRWMDPALAHFASPDTIVPGTGNPVAWDRYLYTLGNPINHFDPTGHLSIAIHDSGEYATPMSEVLKTIPSPINLKKLAF